MNTSFFDPNMATVCSMTLRLEIETVLIVFRRHGSAEREACTLPLDEVRNRDIRLSDIVALETLSNGRTTISRVMLEMRWPFSEPFIEEGDDRATFREVA